jgi:hypothetical protein
MATYSLVNNGDSGLDARTKINVIITDINSGTIGSSGTSGSSGNSGTSGSSGTSGTSGETTTWTSSASDPGINVGTVAGDQWLDTSTGDVYEWDGSSWNSTGNIKGSDGSSGESGTSGSSGSSGESGSSGSSGTSGLTPVDTKTFFGLTASSSVVWNYAQGYNANLSLSATVSSIEIQGATNGDYGTLLVTNTNNYTLNFGTVSSYKFSGNTYSITGGTSSVVDIFTWVYNGTHFYVNFNKNF